jgi:hypothetical protein
MKTVLKALIPATFLLAPISASADFTCPRTISPAPNWYGSDALAVHLSPDGFMPTTAPGALIAVKMFWRSAGYKPFMESNLKITVKELSGAPMTAVVSRPTNAKPPAGEWMMLTGVDFPKPGCFEFTADYLGQKLKFVVETVQSQDFSRLRQAAK